MDKQEKIRLLNDIKTGRVSIDDLAQTMEPNLIDKLTVDELLITRGIIRKHAIKSTSLAGSLAYGLDRQEQDFIQHILKEAPHRGDGFNKEASIYAEFRDLPLPEQLSNYFNRKTNAL